MPKRKDKKNRRRPEPESSSRGESETASVASEMSDLWIANEASMEDIVKDLIEGLQEKRSATRMKALKKLCKLLQTKFAPEVLEGSLLTIQSVITNGLRSKDVKEAVLACQVLGLLSITFGLDLPNSFSDLLKVLHTIAADHTKNAAFRGAAFRTLAMLCFVSIEDPFAAGEVMKLSEAQFKSKEPGVTEGATSAWTLIASTMGSKVLANQHMLSAGQKLLIALDGKDADTKQNAGRALAMLCEACDEVEASMDSKLKEDIERLMDNIVDKLSDLATTSDKSQNKKEKARQRASFREFLQSVESGSGAVESFIISSNDITIEGWVKVTQFGEIRRWLGIGLQTHMKENPLLGDIFKFSLQYLSRGEEKEAREDKIQFAKMYSRVKKEKYQKVRMRKTQAMVRTEEDL
eukprot:CAMPEP_0184480156 /NCGR_PEP_ID=MMETSP0113_2-20130426/1636_1 /TAXON_ID=91329 /ORGANISM="Norrisiella sphaerica, Strain BC52" /LENGTH=406 /DNA_ID=CAMNT_0026858433 /DNA_START=66 /DNA_END=1286 /DNA_ORIENTATION=+